MAFQVNNAAQLVKRAGGLLGGLLGNDDDDASDSSSAAPAAATTNAGLLGGLENGLSSVGAGITSGLGGVTSALGGLSPTTTTTFSSSSSAVTSSAASTTQSATVASSTSTSSSSSSALTTSSSVPLSSAPLSSSSPVPLSSTTPSAVASSASSTITAAPSVWVQTEGGQAVTITSHITAQAAESTTSAVPAPAGFLQNKGAVAGTFTVVGLVVLVILFIASTWCIRRNKRNRLLEEAVDWSPQTHLGGGAAVGAVQDTEKGYPSDLYRTNSGSSNNSRSTAQRYAAPSTYRDQQQPPLPSQNMYGNTGNAYGGYYDKPVPAAPGSQYAGSQYAPSIAPSQRTQRTQQGYGQTTYGQYPAYNQPVPPPSLQPAQNPFNPNASTALVAPQFDRSHARTPSPTDSDMAYLGYVDAPGNGVQLGRKVSLTKATATTVDGTSTASNGTIAQSTLKIVNE